MSWRVAAALCITAMLGGCAGDEAALVRSVWLQPDPWSEQTVYYVTDRERIGDWSRPGEGDWGGFGKSWADRLSCGTRNVDIPRARLGKQSAAFPPPESQQKNPYPPAIACQGAAGPLDGFVQALLRAAKDKGCDRVLLYVHGFNTLFHQAVFRAAQMAEDTQSACVTVAFSWSSEGTVPRYVADVEHSAYAVPELESLLRAIAGTNLRLDVIAHSVGVRVTLSALASMAAHGAPPSRAFIDQLVLAAADVGVETGNNDFAHLVHDAEPFVARTTVYASAGDAVLVISESAHDDVPRAGREPNTDRDLQTPRRKGTGTMPEPVLDVIDATNAPADVLGHSYFGLSYEAVRDIALVLAGVPASDRLAAEGGWPATLVCKPAHRPCDARLPHYALNVASDRRPGWVSRLIRKLAPVMRRVEMP